MRLRRPRAPAQAPWACACEPIEPVLDVEVHLIAAPGDDPDWLRGDQKGDVIALVEERTAAIVGARLNGRPTHTGDTPFNHRGLTVHITMSAPVTDAVEAIVENELDDLQFALQTDLQSQFAWEHAAVTVQIETNPAHDARIGRPRPRGGRRGDITVYQPPGGSNAIAPVIVTMPQHAQLPAMPDHYHALPVRGRERSAAVSGWLGALCAFAVVIVAVLAVGPLNDRIGELYEQRQRMVIGYETNLRELRGRLAEREQRIGALERQVATLNRSIDRLSSRRGRPAQRWDQPPAALPDTGQVVVGAADTIPGYPSSGAAAAAP